MKYFATIGSNEYEIEISQDTVTLNGAVLDVDLAQSGVPELYSLILGGASYEALIEPSAQDYAVTLRGEQFHVRIEDERTRRLSAGRRGPAAPRETSPSVPPSLAWWSKFWWKWGKPSRKANPWCCWKP